MFQYFDTTATFLWAISGAMLGARRGYDLIGILVVALVSSSGGGLLRDLFLQQGPPRLLSSMMLPTLIIVATLIVFVFGSRIRTFKWFGQMVVIVDALGLGAYAVFGMNLARMAGLPTMGVILIGMLNAVSGSVLRDILIGARPQLLQPGVPFGQAALFGCLFNLALEKGGVDPTLNAWLTIGVVFVLRIASARFNVRSRPLKAFAEDWRDHYDPN